MNVRAHKSKQLALDRCLQLLEEAQVRGQSRVDGPLGVARLVSRLEPDPDALLPAGRPPASGTAWGERVPPRTLPHRLPLP